ncbi:phosphatidylinositol 3,4,5-trisphosphate 5-phosphatase 2 [Bombina bombina]|uniref:phosphatidylinositol 3,4,5-trisphosphate 5-phosphatase 2 n=1 Tax=Bombina bombina TaxID=8345 RepID=UPI00235A7D91|nr:phosphatidylinositol 3,4,5-trisphosphate 5-phosphatase 2 [Bombina bombina]
MCEGWYYTELSQTHAEQLLVRDGRDGAFLVRQSESVRGAFAICLLYQQQVHTYRILPDENGLLSVKSMQGVEVMKFSRLSELVSAYAQKQNGLITNLQHPVEVDREDGAEQIGLVVKKSTDRKDTLCTELSTLSPLRGTSICKRFMPKQKASETTSKEAVGLFLLGPELEKQCEELDREIEHTWCSLKILTMVFGHMASLLHRDGDQVSVLDKLIHKVSSVQELLTCLESKLIPSDRNQLRKCPPQNLSVFTGTWNMGGSLPPRSISSWLSSKGMGQCSHDLFMIGTQENPQGDREWAEFLRLALKSQTGKEYKVVSACSLGAVKLVLLVKSEYEDLIDRVHTSSVRTGLCNTLGNRGAVGVSLEFNRTSLGFVTCHLVSGNDKVQKRNQSCGEILRCLALGDESLRSFQLPMRLTHLFWAGDLNYKLNMPVQDILQCVYSGQYQFLLPVDQLNQERERKKIFLGFKEEQITFPPTCRYEKGTRTYDVQKAKTTGTRLFAPSWSDRVLWSSYPDTEVKCTSYGCTDDIITSDHSPVFATFEIGLECQLEQGTRCILKFHSIEAIIKTQNKSCGCIEFRSLCSQGSSQSKVNSTHTIEGTAFLKLGWSVQDLPELIHVGLDNEYLLLSIRPTDGGESYGECCVSLRALHSRKEHHFQAFLSQRGEETGSLRGWASMFIPQETQANRSPNTQQKRSEKDGESVCQIAGAAAPPNEAVALQFSSRLSRRRPASLSCVPGSYSNAEYFLFEGMTSPHTPTSPRPHSAIVIGEEQSTDQWGGEPRIGKKQSILASQSKRHNRASLWYIGITTRELRTRLGEHISSIKNCLKDQEKGKNLTPVAKHYLKNHGTKPELKASVLQSAYDKYLAKHIIPRGLRVRLFPTFSFHIDTYKDRWEQALINCSEILVAILSDYETEVMSELDKEISEYNIKLQKFETLDKFKQSYKEMREELDKREKEIIQTKCSKMKRDIKDFEKGRIFTWDDKQPRRRPPNSLPPSKTTHQ